jgi:hypothetical protein
VRPWRQLGEDAVQMTVDRHIFSRDAVKRATVALVDRCFVELDLDDDGAVVVTLSTPEPPIDGELRHLAGELGNLLLADLAERKLDAQSRAARNLLLARALDGALPKGGPGRTDTEGGAS